MDNRKPLGITEKESIYLGKVQGRTLVDLATSANCSIATARKWWRVGRDYGLEGLRAIRPSRGETGPLSHFDARIAEAALRLKRMHPGWGPQRVLVDLSREPDLAELELPQCSCLANFFKVRCPECVAVRRTRNPLPPRPPDVTGVHEMWGLDSQEGIRLSDGNIALICNIRDPVGAAMIASQAFSVKTERRWRKLEWNEVRDVLRNAFTQWHTLPDGVQTDNELGLAGGPNDPYPGLLTFWLVGLGIKHRLIRPGCPTDQPHIERNHRTLDGFALDEAALVNIRTLQAALDRERHVHNYLFPSRASDCAGQPPVIAHPELLQPRRYFEPELEPALFDIQRVHDYLATFTFTRTVNASAQVSLGKQIYSLGRPFARERHLRTVLARLDPDQHEWIFFTEANEELIRRPLKGVDAATLTGLDPDAAEAAQPVQLAFPCFV